MIDGAAPLRPPPAPTTGEEAQALISAFDGSHLFHAYGMATDTRKLRGLFKDKKGRKKATLYLYSALLHQGTPWTSTAPLTSLLVRCYPAAGKTSRAIIATFVADVAESVDLVTLEDIENWIADTPVEAKAGWERIIQSGDDDAYEQAFDDPDVANYMYYLTLLEILEGRQAWGRQLAAHLPTSDLPRGLHIARAMRACGLRDEAARYLSGKADNRTAAPMSRAFAIYELGSAGEDVSNYLIDDNLAVRAAAAFATPASDGPANAVVLETLRDPAALDRAFEGDLDPFDIAPSIAMIGRLTQALAEGFVPQPRALVDVALSAARNKPELPANWGWGLLVAPVMAGATPGLPLNDEQRRYLAGLTELDVWSPTNGNNSLLFRKAGLPYSRKDCRNLALGAPLEETA